MLNTLCNGLLPTAIQVYAHACTYACERPWHIILSFYIAVTCDCLPIQLLHRPVTVVMESHDIPSIEGQFITYTCPPEFTLTGPNTSVCMGNREWKPDPREVDCIGNYPLWCNTLAMDNYTYIIRT